MVCESSRSKYSHPILFCTWMTRYCTWLVDWGWFNLWYYYRLLYKSIIKYSGMLSGWSNFKKHQLSTLWWFWKGSRVISDRDLMLLRRVDFSGNNMLVSRGSFCLMTTIDVKKYPILYWRSKFDLLYIWREFPSLLHWLFVLTIDIFSSRTLAPLFLRSMNKQLWYIYSDNRYDWYIYCEWGVFDIGYY